MIKNYPTLGDRIKAQAIDGGMYVLFLFAMTLVFSAFDNVPDEARMIGLIFIFCLYNPLMVAFFGGTLGHKMADLKVVQKNDHSKYPSILPSILRFIIKSTIGFASLIFIITDDKNRALHDVITGSLVLYDEE